MTQPYSIVDEFSPELAASLLDHFEHTDFYVSEQEFPEHYSDLMYLDSQSWPGRDEVYRARFLCAADNGILRARPVQKFREIIASVTGCGNLCDPYIYRLDPGCHLRCHLDGFIGNVGYTYFLNRGWRWDWGGILYCLEGEHDAKPIYPLHDRLLVRDETKSIPHFVDLVAPWALGAQYLMIGFGRK